MAAATLFVADLHLCAERESSARLFEDFLAGPARAAAALYVLGDLFEAMAGDDDLDDPFNARICARLRALTRTVPGRFLAGNRDFLAGPRFAQATGLEPIGDPTRIELDGVPTLLLHGDTLCTDDEAYQDFRALVRSPAWREDFLRLPLAQRRARVERMRAGSEQAKRGKPAVQMDINAGALARLLREHGYPRVIHGHTHLPARHRIEIDGRTCERWVLPDWYAGGGYLACDEAGCRLIALARSS
ncbi:MAG TPA: UDP-2,3-diacylglucosamine diphosphatase [Rhodocyclaceae bacterium]|nr:MAG: UDP-2,3-diacylglucosamine diphosphatase [Betaproteobacteria bacterium CG2_30_68_42]PIV72553.1 MAG: UDP-2,3-diacylglucosamine diphosphatase [Rhodocyclales bacterium CG17_big_fil_post_rev_8_21_14_2_50_68_7]PIX75026.1 MAG: UDP-2,3-diacylglucosamine diphosphatase [Rhodocyclales bacterium CG_4_10_14_3_um_filter_68_10]PJA57841.1 MAG: UDP-2,3-diacylglucosamine diphosphatase [Rhodocyclales bacterium CG_4_9_14_3_um_filter_68_10]HCX32750.1 UDP-2,3-diacylglucosamine diphosphatase [Rhodocyclaceae b